MVMSNKVFGDSLENNSDNQKTNKVSDKIVKQLDSPTLVKT